jgi:beta-glucosidase-like glycosyl hydrolase
VTLLRCPLDRQQLDPTIPLDDPFSETTALSEAPEGIVLLKNKGNLLPLSEQAHSIAVPGPPVISGDHVFKVRGT